MEFTAVDSNGRELGIIQNIKQADIEIGDTNTFELVFLRDEWLSSDELPTMDHFCCYGNEIGGRIKKIKVLTEKGQVKVSGYTWRGNLAKKIIEPPEGEAYLIVSGDANEILSSLVDDEFSGMIVASKELSGISIKSYQFSRYCTMLDGINSMLEKVGAKLKLQYIPSKDVGGVREKGFVEISAIPITDYSGQVDFTADGRIHMTATDDQTGVNHLVCLGKGELASRKIIHLYVDKKGNVGQLQYYTGIDEIAETYDYSSVESEEELLNSGTKKLNELKNKRSIEISPDDIDVDIGDIVGGREDITGISMKTSIIRIIYKINTNGILTKQYKVGD